METIKITYWTSPVGEMILGSFCGALCLCDWVGNQRRETVDKRLQTGLHAKYEEASSQVVQETITQLEAYFAGTLKDFSVPLLLVGSEFQKKVWQELSRIPYGTAISYRELAIRIDNPKAVRAVASANAVNAISVILPCHRVIGSDKRLVGYGGGLKIKSALLDLESSFSSADSRLSLVFSH